jgi:hypothetical protein
MAAAAVGTVAKTQRLSYSPARALKMLHFRPSCSLLLGLSLPLFVACGYGDHMHDGNGYYGPGNGSYTPPASQTIEQATIDVDRAVDFETGKGPGVYIEYDAGGSYRVDTSCDGPPRSPCYWDILVTPLDGASVLGVAPAALESDDSVAIGSGNQVRFVAYTDDDSDGFTLQTDPGASIEVDALLENSAANAYLFWVGDGALHTGAPSNPVDLIPSDQ